MLPLQSKGLTVWDAILNFDDPLSELEKYFFEK